MKYIKLFKDYAKWNLVLEKSNAKESSSGINKWTTWIADGVKKLGSSIKSVFDKMLAQGKALADKLGKELRASQPGNEGPLRSTYEIIPDNSNASEGKVISLFPGEEDPAEQIEDANTGKYKGYYYGTGAWYLNTLRAQEEGKNKFKSGSGWKIYPIKDTILPDVGGKDVEVKAVEPFTKETEYVHREGDDKIKGEVEDEKYYADFEDEDILPESLKYIKLFEDDGDFTLLAPEGSMPNREMEGAVKSILQAVKVSEDPQATEYRKILMWGAPGIGKTQVMKQVATQLGKPLIVIPLANMEPTDLLGLPFLEGEGYNQVTGWAPPILLPRMSEGKTTFLGQGGKEGAEIQTQDDAKLGGIIFLDEINRAQESVLNACLTFVQDRIIGGYKLPENWHIMAACNRAVDINDDQLQAMDSAVASTGRFQSFNLVPYLPQWLDYARSPKMKRRDVKTKEVLTTTDGLDQWKIPTEIIDFLEATEYDANSIEGILGGNKSLQGKYKHFYRNNPEAVDSVGQGLHTTPRQWAELGAALSVLTWPTGSGACTDEKGKERECRDFMDYYRSHKEEVHMEIENAIAVHSAAEFINFLDLRDKIKTELVEKVWEWRKLYKNKSDRDNNILSTEQKKILSQLPTSNEGIMDPEGTAFLSALSGMASVRLKKLGILELVSLLDFLTQTGDEVKAVTQLIRTAFPIWLNIKKTAVKKISNAETEEEKLKEMKQDRKSREAWGKWVNNPDSKLRAKWGTSITSIIDNLRLWEKNKTTKRES
jgi:MoxR-like ATPase